MRLLVLTENGIENASARHRAFQFVDLLEQRLGSVDLLPPETPREPAGRSVGRRVAFAARHFAHFARHGIAIRRHLRAADAVFVQRGVYPAGPGLVAQAVVRFNGPVVLDLDDAVHLARPSMAGKGRVARYLYGPQQTTAILRRADALIVSTPEVAAALPTPLPPVTVLPTIPNARSYAVGDPGRLDLPIRVGWVGNAGNLEYLDPLKDVFRRLTQEGVATLEVVSSRPWAGPSTFRRWSREEEHHLFARHDVGVMPLSDTPYTRAKAGFKLLQSMAAGVPVVASPVGTNLTLLERSGAGLAASTPAEWEHALRWLAARPDERVRLGASGRRFVMEIADLDSHADTIADVIRSAASD